MADVRLVVCVNERLGPGQKSCGGSGSKELIEAIRGELDRRGLSFTITEQVCLGRCEEGIAMRIAPGGAFFTEVGYDDIASIVGALVEFEKGVHPDRV